MANRALLVGINAYNREPLRGCINDVLDVEELLRTKCNFVASDIRVLVDAKATSTNIRQQLEDWLVLDTAPHDRLLFHFSGHGTRMPGRDGTVHDVICPVDFDFTEARALSDADFSAIFGRLPANVYFNWISDSCHSGDLARTSFLKSGAIARYLPPPPELQTQIDELLARGARTRGLYGTVERIKGVLVAGCQSDEKSADAYFGTRPNGALTYYLLDALRQEGALSRDIETIVGEVQRALKNNRYLQHPQIRGLPELRQKPFLAMAEALRPAAVSAAVVEQTQPAALAGPRATPLSEDTRFVPAPSHGNKKLAFVLGNADYSHVQPLLRTIADANLVRERLGSLGFAVHGGVNAELNTLKLWFDDFERRIKPTDTVLLYYAGHGVQMSGENYLLPVDGSLSTLEHPPEVMRMQGLVDRILAAKAARCLVILDACRDNPFLGRTNESTGARGVDGHLPSSAAVFASRGLAPLEVVRDAEAFVAFAAEPGRSAYEGGGPNGYFTGALARHIDTSGLDLERLMQRVGADVKKVTQNRQRPWTQSNLTSDFHFKPASWEPVWWLAGLGALSGLPASWFVFDHQTAQFTYEPFGGVFFASVVGYGIWRWGRRTISSALLTTIASILIFAAGSWILKSIGVFNEPRSEFSFPFWENTLFLRDLIAAQIVGPLFVFGAFIAGSLTTPALRRWRVYGFAAVAGILVAAIVFGIAAIQYAINPTAVGRSDFVLDVLGAALWQGMLGAALGYGLSDYVPPPNE